MDYGHWQYTQEFDPAAYFGFVYCIVRSDTGRKYIGKKQFNFKNRKKVKGRKNRKVVISNSGWQIYTGSCDELNNDIEKLGKDKFQFFILKLCKTKRDLGYEETAEQFKRNVLYEKLDNGERAYYNAHILSRYFINEGHTEETRQKMSENHWLKRLEAIHPMQNKHHTEEAKQKISQKLMGHISASKGKKVPKLSFVMMGNFNGHGNKGKTHDIEYWWTNGNVDKRQYQSPGPEWKRGRLNGHP